MYYYCSLHFLTAALYYYSQAIHALGAEGEALSLSEREEEDEEQGAGEEEEGGRIR